MATGGSARSLRNLITGTDGASANAIGSGGSTSRLSTGFAVWLRGILCRSHTGRSDSSHRLGDKNRTSEAIHNRLCERVEIKLFRSAGLDQASFEERRFKTKDVKIYELVHVSV